MKITIYGAGYVGLVTGACLADVGNEVLLVDVDDERVAALNRGKIPIYEPGLATIIQRCVQSGQRFHHRRGHCCGPWPTHALRWVHLKGGWFGGSAVCPEVARTVGRHMDDYRLVVDKSTVPVGTADQVSKAIADELKQRGVDLSYSVASNPEFLKGDGQ